MSIFARIADEVAVLDRCTFRHASYGVLRPNREMESHADAPVLPYLWRLLYLSYHAGDHEAARLLVEGGQLVLGLPDWEEPDFVARLRTASRCDGYVSPGWTVTGGDGDHFRVLRNDLTLNVKRDELRCPAKPQVGDAVGVRFPPELPYTSPGWWIAVGDAGTSSKEATPIVRLYFTLADSNAAPTLLRGVTELLNGLAVPFEVKVVNSRSRCCRRDAFIIYLERADWDVHSGELRTLYAANTHLTRDDGPPFTRRLGPGWSLAEEPANVSGNLSFGQHRCLLVAEALVDAQQRGSDTPGGRFRAIAQRFQRAGLDLERPYQAGLAEAPA